MRNREIMAKFDLRHEFDSWCVANDAQLENFKVFKGNSEPTISDYCKLPVWTEMEMLLSLVGLEDLSKVS